VKDLLTATAFCFALYVPNLAYGQAISLQPASPQPSKGELSQGLSVKYAVISSKVRTLEEAKTSLKKHGKRGLPIVGLAYEDTEEGEQVLTSELSEQVAADISGYIQFKSAGNYTLDFLANDGLQIEIGGHEVGYYDGIHPCGYVGEIEVNIPSAGYYPVHATYFQRKGTACLMMEWGPDSDGLELTTNDVFFHKP
jgi:hypothetical protein